MDQQILDYLSGERVGVLAVTMPDGSPHGATIHFAHIADPLTFVFMTSPKYKKVQAFEQGETLATFVVGVDEGTMRTLQMDGTARLADTQEIRQTYFDKFPDKLDKFPDNIFIAFTPNWWRYSDMKNKVVLSSDAQ